MHYTTGSRTQIDQVQHNAIQTYTEDKFLDTILLNQSLVKYLKQHGTAVDTDEISRLLDGK